MGSVEDALDNALCESVFATLPTEPIEHPVHVRSGATRASRI